MVFMYVYVLFYVCVCWRGAEWRIAHIWPCNNYYGETGRLLEEGLINRRTMLGLTRVVKSELTLCTPASLCMRTCMYMYVPGV